MKFEKLQPGMTVYSVGQHKMGNTTTSTVAVWPVRIVEVDAERRQCMAEWNHNKAQRFFQRDVEKWREKEPMLVRSGFGHRLATREERKAARAAVGAA